MPAQSEAKTESPRAFPGLLRARCPASLPSAVELAARRQCMTASEYIRHSVVKSLQADGIDPAKVGA
jgi:hypothetical protein